ncbi:hypothetical protein ACCO45_005020 [Purpureocillium lilacinum]|uniref:Uncharacterized protein n=1 Tax=Purpureocillium lilacinum TaxID=33203 RepID=A0ACC4DXA3_PURLI
MAANVWRQSGPADARRGMDGWSPGSVRQTAAMNRVPTRGRLGSGGIRQRGVDGNASRWSTVLTVWWPAIAPTASPAQATMTSPIDLALLPYNGRREATRRHQDAIGRQAGTRQPGWAQSSGEKQVHSLARDEPCLAATGMPTPPPIGADEFQLRTAASRPKRRVDGCFPPRLAAVATIIHR